MSNNRAGAMGGGMRQGQGEKANNFSKTWKDLIKYCKPYYFMVAIAFLLSVTGSIFTIIGPNQLSKITDLITEGLSVGIDLKAISKIGMILAILYVLGFIFSYLESFMMSTVSQRLSKRLRTDISGKINRLPLKYFDNNSYGDVLSRVTNDVDTIGKTFDQSLGTLVSAITLFLGALIMMLMTNLIMALTAVATTFLGFGLMMLIMSKSQKYFTAQQVGLGEMNGYIEETYTGHNILKVYNGQKESGQKFHMLNENLKNSAWKSQFMSGLMMPLMSFIGNLGYVAVCVVGAVLAMNGKVTMGVIVAFMMYIRFFTQPLSQMAQAATSLQSAAAASERVFEFLNEEEMEDEREKTAVLETAKGDVEFSHVKFGYNKDKIIINDFSADVAAGQKIAIVGPTGAGKTTIVNLLMRFYEVNSGEIKIDGVPIQDLTRDNVHDLFCMVLQDTWLFEGTIKENIIFSKTGVSDATVVAACKSIGVDHFIRTLPQGYDTILDDSANLSVGQKQLITIARAIVEDAPLLILDEATSSVDTRTEELIQDAMDKLMVGRTSFVIAHRLSTIKNSDLILVMKDGDIIESGNHEELLDKKGFYASLYNSQFEAVS